jgi:HprK-related kinase A
MERELMEQADNQTVHCRIGVVSASLQTRMRGLLRQYAALYRHFRTDGPGPREISVRVQPRRRPLWRRRRYEVIVNGRLQFTPSRREEVLPFVEWAVNWEVPRLMPEYLQLHASSMEVDGVGVIFPGGSGRGKSTLTAGLLAHGWRYLCDEFALIHAETLQLHPFPRAICIKKGSSPVMDALGLRLQGGFHSIKHTKGRVGFLCPVDVRADAVGGVCPIRYVIFPQYVAGAVPTLKPIGRAEAAFALHEVCWNLLSCRALGLDVLADMVRGAMCYRLTCGEIRATCQLVGELVRAHNDRRIPDTHRSRPREDILVGPSLSGGLDDERHGFNVEAGRLIGDPCCPP